MFYTTQQLILALQSANPTETITEAQIRRTIRDGRIEEPTVQDEDFIWTQMEVRGVAEALDLVIPERFLVSPPEGVTPRKAPTVSMSPDEYREWLGTQPAPRILVPERSAHVTKPEGLSDEAMALLNRIWSYPIALPVADMFSPQGLGLLDAKEKSRFIAMALTELICRGLVRLWVIDEWNENAVRDAITFIANFDPTNQSHLDEVAKLAHSLKVSAEAYTHSEGNVRLVPVVFPTPEGSAIFEKVAVAV